MSLFWGLYFIDILSNFSAFCVLLTITTLFINFIIFCCNSRDYKLDGFSKYAIRFHLLGFVLSVIFLIISIAIPSSKTMYSMLAVKCSERINIGEDIPKKIIMVIDKKLDSYLKDE